MIGPSISTQDCMESSTIDLCSMDDEDDDSPAMMMLIDLSRMLHTIHENPNIIPHTESSVRGPQKFGTRRNLVGQIRTCQKRGMGVGLYILGLGGGLKWRKYV